MDIKLIFILSFFVHYISAYYPSFHDLVNSYENDVANCLYSHWLQYLDTYEKNTIEFRHSTLSDKKEIRMLEIGVQHGGSMVLWRKYFGSTLYYTGYDIQPPVKQLENKSIQQFIEIGNQNDIELQRIVCKKHGLFHFIIDDGGHSTIHMMNSLIALWGCLQNKALYTIEDLHSVHMWHGEYLGKDIYNWLGVMVREISVPVSTTTATNINSDAKTSKDVTDLLDSIRSHLSHMEIYDSIVFLHYLKDKHSLQPGSSISSSTTVVSSPLNTNTNSRTSLNHPLPAMHDILFKHKSSKHFQSLQPFAATYDEMLWRTRSNNTRIHTLFVSAKKGFIERMGIWREYLGPAQVYVAIQKSNSKSPRNHRDLKFDGTHVELGNLLNTIFATGICDRYGPFDLVVDDSDSYTATTMKVLETLWFTNRTSGGCLADNAVYVIEDLMAKKKVGGDIGLDMFDMIAGLGRNMSDYFKNNGEMNHFSAHLSGIDLYPNIAFLHYQKPNRDKLIQVSKGEREIKMIPWNKLERYLVEWKKTQSESPAALAVLSDENSV